MSPRRHNARRRGASLVEALVALAIMAFGMLSLIGVQATMRLNSDLAKQRTEATRIATEDIERQRRFSLMAADGAQPNASYEEIQALNVDPYVAPGGIGNTSYRVERTVTTVAEPKQKVLTVRVLWNDRTGARQTVTVDAVISATDPALSGLLAVPPVPSATNQRNGRHNSIPPESIDLRDGTSAFKPFDTGTVAWIFNNLTGLITSRCTGVTAALADLTRDNLTTCGSPINGRLLSGEVAFNFRFLPSNLSADTAVLKPAVGANLAWVIGRGTRQIERICTVPAATAQASLTLADLTTGCTAVNPGADPPGRPVTPYQVQCDPLPCTDSGSLNAADSELPRWPVLNLDIVRVGTGDSITDTAQFNQPTSPECLDDAPATLISATSRSRPTVRYYCLIYTDTSGWGGRFSLQPLGFSDAGNVAWTVGTAGYKVCRYTTAASNFTLNADHPATYCMEKSGAATRTAACSGKRVTGSITNQNFLVIAASQACPTDVAIDPAAGNLINSNTRQHQP